MSSRALEANKNRCTREIDKRTPCEKNLGKKERTTGAEDTQNQHYQRVRTVVDRMIDDLDNVDFISSNVLSSRQEALLYIFEDNEAVIKMIIKGRSPTMRHVSRTHRVALDWLFDRVNLDPKIQIKYVDTKNQLGDILTKGYFTRDERESSFVLVQRQPFEFH